MGRHIREDAAQRSHPKRLVVGHRDVMLAASTRREPNVRSGSARRAGAEGPERTRQLASREVPRELHAKITSSRTKWRRITFGAAPSSKWQRTASRTRARSSPSVSASVKIEAPSARAYTPLRPRRGGARRERHAAFRQRDPFPLLSRERGQGRAQARPARGRAPTRRARLEARPHDARGGALRAPDRNGTLRRPRDAPAGASTDTALLEALLPPRPTPRGSQRTPWSAMSRSTRSQETSPRGCSTARPRPYAPQRGLGCLDSRRECAGSSPATLAVREAHGGRSRARG